MNEMLCGMNCSIYRRKFWRVKFSGGKRYFVLDSLLSCFVDVCLLGSVFSIDGTMYQPGYPCVVHDVLYFGLLWITNIVPGGASGVRL